MISLFFIRSTNNGNNILSVRADMYKWGNNSVSQNIMK